MPPKGHHQQQQNKKRQRTHTTNRSVEAQQFSSVRLPRSSEVQPQKVNVDAMHADVSGGGGYGIRPTPSSSPAGGGAAAVFDPIPNDPMFYPVEGSRYWPPPSLEALQKATGVSVVGTDGFDSYDRRADDETARKEKAKVVKGELNHPRGKARKNVIVKLSNSDSDDEDGGESDNSSNGGAIAKKGNASAAKKKMTAVSRRS